MHNGLPNTYNKKLKSNHFIWVLLAFIFLTTFPTIASATLYEDAEDGDIQGNTPINVRGWFVYDYTPAGATITNVYDTVKQSRVIQFNGEVGTNNNGYMLGDWYPTSSGTWNNTSEFNINWCSRYSNAFVVFMRVYTTNAITSSYVNSSGEQVYYDTKQRYIYYTPITQSFGPSATYKQYIHFGLGLERRDGNWHSIHRDLQADLQQHEPTNSITSVTAFLVRGNGKVDDISLSQAPLNPVINLKKTVKTQYDPVNGNINPKAIPGAVLEYTLKAQNFGFKHADNNTTVLRDNIPNNMKTCVANIGQCKTPYLINATNSSGMSLGTITYTVNGIDTATPVADADGYNSSVSAIKIAMNGEFPDMCTGNHSFEIKFRTGIE